MRAFLIFVFTIISFCIQAQYFSKSIYGDYLHGASVIQNQDSSYAVFTKHDQLISMQLDKLGNILWTKMSSAAGVRLDNEMIVERISDSTFIIASTCYYVSFVFDIYLAKVDSSGNPIWIKSIGNPSDIEEAHSVKHTLDDGFVIVGQKFIGSPSSGEIYIVKVDSIGKTQWSKGFDRPSGDIGFDVVETGDGFVTAGSTYGVGIDSSFGVLIKTDKSGNTIWTKSYSAPLSYVYSIIKDGDFFLLAGGNQIEGYIGDLPTGDVVLLKTDSMGHPFWTKQYHFDDPAYVTKIIKTIDGGYLLLGMSGNYSYPTGSRCFFMKTDSMGNMLWCTKYGGETTGYGGRSLQQAPNGDLLSIVDYYTNKFALMIFRTDSLGNGAGVCEMPVTSIVSSPIILDSNLVFTETFYNDSSVSIPFSVTQDSLIAIDSCVVSPLGVFSVYNSAAKVYPNPAMDALNIDNVITTTNYQLLNIIGSKLQEGILQTGSNTINIKQLPRGLYLLRMTDADRTTTVSKVEKL